MTLPVFVINLDRRPDRWAAMSTQLDRLGIGAVRIPAVDARLLAAQEEWERDTNGDAPAPDCRSWVRRSLAPGVTGRPCGLFSIRGNGRRSSSKTTPNWHRTRLPCWSRWTGGRRTRASSGWKPGSWSPTEWRQFMAMASIGQNAVRAHGAPLRTL